MPTEFEPADFDPLSTEHLTRTICRAFEEQPLISLGDEIPRFSGSGLYAIYYTGEQVEPYVPLVGYKIPVYVGSAQSHNSATGVRTKTADRLWRRVNQHRHSIAGGGLSVDEFGARLLRMPDVHVDLGENGLRVGYQPVWNAIATGFGSNEQGASTRQSRRSKWDTLHPGRSRSFGADAHDVTTLKQQVREHVLRQIDQYESLPWHRDRA